MAKNKTVSVFPFAKFISPLAALGTTIVAILLEDIQILTPVFLTSAGKLSGVIVYYTPYANKMNIKYITVEIIRAA